MATHVEDFRAAMSAAGLKYSGLIFGDGKLHRFKSDEDHDEASWYVLHATDPKFAAGAFGCWRRQLNEKWHSQNGATMSQEEREELNRKWKAAENDRRTEEEKRRSEAKLRASQILSAATIPSSHPYLERKKIGVHGELRVDNKGCLVLALRDDTDVLQSLQFIAPDKRFHGGRDKDFIPGGKVHGTYFAICDTTTGPVVICEGYATGASIFEATGWCVICAMFCGNLKPVAQIFRKLFPNRTIILAADNDRFSKDNPGVTKAKEAAEAVKGFVAIPDFADTDENSTDFNDLALTSGLSAVRRVLDALCPMSFLSFESVVQLILPKEHVLMGDHVLSVGNIATIVAPGGVGKSSIIEQLAAACAARHEKFLKWSLRPAFWEQRWLIIQAENSAYRLKRDATAIRNWIGDEAWKRFNEHVRVLVPLQDVDAFLDLDQPEVPLRLNQAIELFSPNVVVFDALYNFSLRELAKGSEMLAAVSNCVRVAKRGNAQRTPILLHHALPGSAGAAKAVGMDRSAYGRDSKVLHQLARSVINIAPASEDDNSQLLISCGKCSDGTEFEPFVVRRDPETLIFNVDDQASVDEIIERLKHPKKARSVMSNEKVRELCVVAGMSKKDLAKAISDDCGCTRTSAYRYLANAEKDGSIKKSVGSDLYFRN